MIKEVILVETATVYENGQTQIILLPDNIHLKSTEVVVKQLGDAVLIVPKESLRQTFLDGVNGFTDDFLRKAEIREFRRSGTGLNNYAAPQDGQYWRAPPSPQRRFVRLQLGEGSRQKKESSMLISTTFEELGPITPEEIEMLEKASKMPIVFDEDSPELTKEELQKFRRVRDTQKLQQAGGKR